MSARSGHNPKRAFGAKTHGWGHYVRQQFIQIHIVVRLSLVIMSKPLRVIWHPFGNRFYVRIFADYHYRRQFCRGQIRPTLHPFGLDTIIARSNFGVYRFCSNIRLLGH